MLEGITVLNSTDIYYCANWMRFFPVGIILGFVLILIGISEINTYYDTIGIVFVVTGAVLSFSSVAICFASKYNMSFDHTEYEVTVSESVSFEEFTSRYEIIDQKGKIYTIKERDQSNEIQK